jgi:hypothetical protein
MLLFLEEKSSDPTIDGDHNFIMQSILHNLFNGGGTMSTLATEVGNILVIKLIKRCITYRSSNVLGGRRTCNFCAITLIHGDIWYT